MTTRQPGRRTATGIEQFLSTIRLLESGSYAGNYLQVGKRVNGAQPQGAYGILDTNWLGWAQRAGIPGADWRDPRAQDRVAAARAQEYVEAYGSFDMAAIAWIGGTESARKIIQRGFHGPEDIQNDEIRQYFQDYQKESQEAPDFDVARRAAPVQAKRQTQGQAQGGWVMPVAGDNEWSKGSWMPNTLTHRGRTHAATDVYAARGTPIVAPVAGKVIGVKKSDIGGFTARIQGDDGIIYYFAHMDQAAVVKAGQRVLAGAHLGFVGNSGSASSTSTHLHFSMKKANGDVINPGTFLSGAGEPNGAYPTAQAYGEGASAFTSGTAQMNGMLDQLSNRIAGGKRKPSADVGEGVGEGVSSTPTTGGEKTTTEVTT